MDHHIKMIETCAMRYEQTKEQQYLELLERSKKALKETLTLQDEALFYLNMKDVRQHTALEAIKRFITEELTESHPLYEKIYTIACKGLEAIERQSDYPMTTLYERDRWNKFEKFIEAEVNEKVLLNE